MDRERNFHQHRSVNTQFYGTQARPQYGVGYDFGQSQRSINFITEDFLAGFQEDGRMSVVRRFFCLFVTFDVIFISLLWIICVVITGQNIYDALDKQVLHYSIYTSLFDVIVAAICRFCILILFYGLCYLNHWTIIALCTSGSCGFLVAKVFYYDWAETPQPLFEVLLVIVSFVLSWGEAWFLDCRVIPQERHARTYFIAATNPIPNRGQYNERSPLLVSFLNSTQQNYNQAPESIGNFYSPIDSAENSDDEMDLTEDYKKIGVEAVKRAFELLESKDWKIEKVTSASDTIMSLHRNGLGKIYRLTARIPCAASILLNNLFYRIEDVPNWNPTLLESKILETISHNIDITYQATIGGGGGMVKSRDFVNLRCWQLLRDGKIIENHELPSVKLKEDNDNKMMSKSLSTQELQKKLSALTESESESDVTVNMNEQMSSSLGAPRSISKEISGTNLHETSTDITSLSKSLGAKHFNDSDQNLSDDEVGFMDAKGDESPPSSSGNKNIIFTPESTECGSESEVYISAAVSVTHNRAPPTQKYIRGENLVSCWAMRQIPQQTNWCIFEWILCLDLKGYIPRYVLDTAYSTLMQDYMKYLRQHCNTINSLSKCAVCNKDDYDKKCLCSNGS